MRFICIASILTCCALDCGGCAGNGAGSSDADTDPDTDTDPDSDSDWESDTQTSSDADSDSDSGAEIDCDTVADADSETTTDTEELCWADDATGLMWQRYADDDGSAPYGYWWDEAVVHCECLKLCGYDDWRMPTISELRTTIRGCPATMTGGECPIVDGYTGEDETGCAGCSMFEGPDELGFYRVAEFEGNVAASWSSFEPEQRPGVALFLIEDSARLQERSKNPEEDLDGVPIRCVRHLSEMDAGTDGGK